MQLVKFFPPVLLMYVLSNLSLCAGVQSNLAQCSQTRTDFLAAAKYRLIGFPDGDLICYSREHVSTALESSGGMLYNTEFDTLHSTC